MPILGSLVASMIAMPVLKSIAKRVVIVLLRHLAEQTDNTLDDQIVDEVEAAMEAANL